MKIYTRAGDGGDTTLYGGLSVSKDDLRVESYGAIDEANAALGVAVAYLSDNNIRNLVARLQSELFIVGADLATPFDGASPVRRSIVPRIEAKHVASLEGIIDTYEAELTPLRSFILPGGDLGSAHLHLARTIIRRAERRIVTLLHADQEHVNENVVPYVNRLADLLFVIARVANRRKNIPDVLWTRADDYSGDKEPL